MNFTFRSAGQHRGEGGVLRRGRQTGRSAGEPCAEGAGRLPMFSAPQPATHGLESGLTNGPWSGAWAQVGPGASTARARPSITPPGQFSLSQYCISSLIPPYRPPYNNETEPDHKTEGNCPRSGRACWSCSRGGCAPRGAPGTRSRVTGSSCDYECVRNTI